jgi:hypothetical protein
MANWYQFVVWDSDESIHKTVRCVPKHTETIVIDKGQLADETCPVCLDALPPDNTKQPLYYCGRCEVNWEMDSLEYILAQLMRFVEPNVPYISTVKEATRYGYTGTF